MNIKIVVAVNSCYFLDNIGLERNILCCSPARNVNGKVVAVKLDLEAECGKGFNNRIIVNLDTCITVNKFLIEAELNIVKLVSVFIRKTRCYLYARVVIAEELNKTCNGSNGHLGIKTLFITHGSICSVSKTSRRFSD